MSLISLIIYLLIVGVIIALVYYVVDAIPIPHPVGKIIKIVAVVIGCLIVILALMQMLGSGVAINLPGV